MGLPKRFPSPVTFGQVISQSFGRFFGKEIQHGYTYLYVWMTNQFGHFTLGFLITFVILGIVVLCGGSLADPWGWLLAVPLGQLAFWSLKEILDFTFAVKRAPHFFPVDKGSIGLDAVTAVAFIAFGLAVAYAVLLGALVALLTLVAVVLLALIPGRYWLIQKLVFQQVGLPFLYRLADFPAVFSREDMERVQRFVWLDSGWKHLLILGVPGSGRTTLAVGIGTEHGLALGVARYTTFFKFLSLADEPTKPEAQEARVLWPWKTSNIVLVDDVDPERPGKFYGPEEAEKALMSFPAEALGELRKRRSVWVLGSPEHADAWRGVFARVLAVAPEELGILALGKPLGKAPKRTLSGLHATAF